MQSGAFSKCAITEGTITAIGRLGVAAAAEGSQEYVEQIGQELAKEFVRNRTPFSSEAVGGVVTDPNVQTAALAAGAAGAVLGGAGHIAAPQADAQA